MFVQVVWWKDPVARGAQTTNKVNAVRVLMPLSTMLQWLAAADVKLTVKRGQILVPNTVPLERCYHIAYDAEQRADFKCEKPTLRFHKFKLRDGFDHMGIAMVELELDYDVECNRISVHTIKKSIDLETDWSNAIGQMSNAIHDYKLAQFQTAAEKPPQLPKSWGVLTSHLNLPVVVWVRPVCQAWCHEPGQPYKRRHADSYHGEAHRPWLV